jgi:hypothetical protein
MASRSARLQVTVARVTPGLPELKEQAKALAPLRKQGEELNKQLNALSATDPARKDLVAKIKENFVQQKPINDEVKKMADTVQFHQEMGGLVGRILLALLLIWGISRVALLKVFQIPALIILPLTYFYFFSRVGTPSCGPTPSAACSPWRSSATSVNTCPRCSRCICVARAAASPRTWADA